MDKQLSIGMRVRTTPAPIPGITTRWSGLAGHIIGFPGEGNVRVRFDGEPGQVTCGPDDVIVEPAAPLTEEQASRLAQLIADERAREERSVWSKPWEGPVTAAGRTGR